MSQHELGDFDSGDDDAPDGESPPEDGGVRPAEEAAAVAGNDTGVRDVVDPDRAGVPDPTGTVEVSVVQVDYTVEGRGADEEPVVHVFGRTPENDLEHVRVVGFDPYFYVPTEDVDEEYLAAEDSITGFEHGYESIRGTEVTKITGRTPRDVGQIRDRWDEHYEADILFPNRLLIDKDLKGGMAVPERRRDDGKLVVPHDEVEAADVQATPRVHTMDIEVDDRRGFPEEGEEPIVCLTAHDSYRDEYVAWLYEAPDLADDAEIRDGLPDHDQLDEDADVEVRTFHEEDAMLDDYIDYLDDTDADIVTGWNCLPADAEVQMADGRTKAIEDVSVGDEVIGCEKQDSTIAEVQNKWKSEKQIYTFDLADHSALRASGEHRVMVGDDETIDWKRGENIEVGDYVLKPRRLVVDEPAVPTLDELVPADVQRFEDEQQIKEFKDDLPYGAVTELAEEFGVSKGTLYHPAVDVWTPERCERAAETYDVRVPDGGRVYRRTGARLDRELTEHELYLAGLVLTDGSMSIDDGVRFYNTREELHDQFPGDNPLEPDGKGCYKQNVLDYATMHAFNGLGIPFGDKNAVDVDLSTVYEMPERYIGRFLAGVIDGDGNVSDSVTVAAENPTIGEWYVRLFKRLGIYATRRRNVVRIPDAERELDRLKESVLPHINHPKKQADIEALDGGKSGRTETIPYALFEPDVGSDEKRIGNDKYRRGINLKRHETTSEEWTEYVFVEVENISKTGTETTYDIETTTHNFIADDCLVHNCDDFDIPYLLDRLDRLDPRSDRDLSIDRLSRVDEVWRSDWGGPDVKGRVVFDLLRGYRSTKFTELDSYRLDAVGEMELDVGKERYAGDIGDLWEDDPERLLEYNLRDVEICVELDRKQEVLAFWQEVAAFVGCKIEDAPTAGDAVDMYVLHEAHGEFALPSKGMVEEGEEFEGGAVFEPITGVKEMVSVLDLKSLYPMCMRTINASPETKVGEEFDGPVYEAPNGTRFRKEPDGIMREMITELLEEREQKKAARDEHDPEEEAYELYDRQQAAVKVIMNCFTPDTDVLTPEGVQNIRDLEVGDEVYSLDPDTLEMEVKPVVETHAYPDYDGDLVDIETDKIDFSVTPNHRMLVRKDETNGVSWDDGDYRFVEAGELDRATNYQLPHDWDGPDGDDIEEVDLTELLDGGYEVWADNDVHGHTFAAELGYYPDKVLKNDLDTTGYVFSAEEFDEHREYVDDACSRFYVHAEPNRKWIPRTYDGDDFLELLAWYVTEGNVYTSEEKEFGDKLRGSATTVKIAQDEQTVADGGQSDHDAIGALLDRMGFDYYVDERCYQFTSRLLGETLEDLCGSGSEDKRIPEVVFEASQQQKRQFLETLIAGDGDRQKGSWRYSTASEQLRDDVLRLCAHLGLTASYSRDSGAWRIYVTEESKNTLRMHRSGSRSTADDGVYCVTVEDNHTLLAGRNGTFQFVGQSLYGVSGWTRFRLYDKDAAGAVTATGRDVIEFTEEVANRLDYKVTYGDTDSVMLELGGDISEEEAIERSFELEEDINDSYAEFAREELGAEEHFFEIEFEKLYRRFFQAGKKKRYAGHIVWKEGKDVDEIDITGFEYKRSDIAPVTKEVQKRVIEMIVKGEDIEDVKSYVHDVIEDFRSGEYDYDDVGIPGGIGKRLDNYDTDTAQVRGAKYANALLGTNFQRGSKPKRLYVESVHPDFRRRMQEENGLTTRNDEHLREFLTDVENGDGVICFEYADQIPEEFEIDWDKMLDKTLKGPIARVLEALDVSWEEVRSGQSQTGLGNFM